MADEQAICTVINEQFGAEVMHKEDELQRIDDRIQLAKMMLHRLRLGILAQQYGLSGFYLSEDYSQENVGVQASWNSFESEFLSSQQQQPPLEEHNMVDKVKEEEVMEEEVAVRDKREGSTPDVCETIASIASSTQSSCVPSEAGDDDVASTSEPLHGSLASARKVSSLLNDMRKHSTDNTNAISASHGHTQETQYKDSQSEPHSPSLPASLSRFTAKKRIIVGNTSQFIDPSARGTIDGSTHKWMVYVRGPSGDSDITSFVKSVRFFLHPSYHPNDIIRISRPPFHLTRYGWGEFPVRVQLEFTDKCNKHIDIIHNLVLDRTHTGHQTLGSETVVDIDLVTANSVTLGNSTSGISSAVSVKNSAMHPFRSTLNSNVKHKNTTPASSGSTECSQHIHHVFLPATSSVDQVHMDHSYAHIVVVSRRPNLQEVSSTAADDDATSLRSGGQPSADVEEATLDDFMHSMVKTVPLCGPESNGFHLVALSVEHFKKWSVGRRRAAEWMRALVLKRLLQTLDPSIPTAASLTTKQVMEWCRKNGYTPLDPSKSSSRGFCKYCGCQLPLSWGRGEETAVTSDRNSHTRCSEMMMVAVLDRENGGKAGSSDEESSSSEEDSEYGEEGRRRERGQGMPTRIRQQFSTLSDPFQPFESLTVQVKKLRVLQERQLREQEVDVLTVPSRKQQVVETVPRFRVPQTPELKWVQQTAGAIGIRIYPAVIDRMYAHVVEHMIYMACTKFARMIMDRAVNESARQVEGDSNEERCIVPLHIYRAVESLESCDFLTNAYMGLPLKEVTAAIPGTDETLREE